MNEKIRWTKELNQFRKLMGNREVTNTKKLEKSIREKGFWPNPIIVNEKYEVIDGQHRLRAAQNVGGIEIPYVVVYGLGIEDCIQINTTQKKWKIADYIACYADQGKIEYITLVAYTKEFPNIPWQTVIEIATRLTEGKRYSNEIKEGRMKIRRTDQEIRKELEILTYYAKYLPKRTGRRIAWCSALRWVINEAGISDKALRDSFEKYASVPELQIKTVASVEHALAQIERIYNYGRKRGKRDIVLEYQVRKAKGEA